jgi:hypothetical protein
VLRPLAALLLIAAPATAAAPALSTGAWWEKVTVTMTDDGKTRSCSYETSRPSQKPKQCAVVGAEGLGSHTVGSKGEYTKITFERRFHPGATPLQEAVQAGDTLLGRQVMALAIDGGGKVSGCKIVDASGDLKPEYGCEEASAEHFEASAGAGAKATREGFMTILIYGHSEQVA